MKVPLRVTINVGFAIALLILLAVSGLSYRTARGLLTRDQQVTRTRDVVSNLRTVLSLMTDAETGQRGYLLTGDEAYLEPYTKAAPAIDQTMAALRSSTANSPDFQQKLDTLQLLIAAKFSELRETLALRKTEGLQAALPVVQTNLGENTMGKIRSQVASMESDESAILGQRNRELAAEAQQTIAIIEVGSILAVVFVGAAMVLVNLGISTRQRIEKDREHLLEQLGEARTRAEKAAREALATSTTLRTIIDTAPVGLVVADLGGTVTFANASASAVHGDPIPTSASMHNPSNLQAVLRPDGQPFPMADLPLHQALLRGESTRDVETRIKRADGSEVVVIGAGNPIRAADGSIVGAVAVYQDITERKRTEEALRQSEASLAYAQQVAHLSSWEWDLRTDTMTRSAEVQRIFGVGPQDLGPTPESFLAFVHPDDRTVLTDAVADAIVQASAFRLDSRIIRADGTERAVECAGEVIVDAAGEPARVVGTIHDITERKQAEEEKERLLRTVEVERSRFRAILDSAANGIIYLDAATGHILSNPAAASLFGHSMIPDQGVAQYLGQIQANGSPITLEDLPSHRAIQGETTDEQEILIVQPDGRRIPVLESAAPVREPDGRVIGAVTVFQDISALKDLERLREEWTSVVAHDLRQPITMIVGFGGFVAKQVEQSAPDLKRPIDNILRSAHRLNRMIGDLLDASRLEAQHLQLDRKNVDVVSLTGEIVERVATISPTSLVRVQVTGEIPRLALDPHRFEQILGNLISNGVKYGSPDTEVLVTIARQDRAILVSVTNHGEGIAPDALSKLFTRFHRIQLEEQHAEGLGLGLYITKGLVEAHGGRIWVESVPGETTSFSFTLPLPS